MTRQRQQLGRVKPGRSVQSLPVIVGKANCSLLCSRWRTSNFFEFQFGCKMESMQAKRSNRFILSHLLWGRRPCYTNEKNLAKLIEGKCGRDSIEETDLNLLVLAKDQLKFLRIHNSSHLGDKAFSRDTESFVRESHPQIRSISSAEFH